MRIFVHEGVYPWGVIEGFKVIKWYDQTQILNGFLWWSHRQCMGRLRAVG